jgi:RNA polymerase sigma-70 factor (ECF subfamily)
VTVPADLLRSHLRFLQFLEQRVHDRALAEDLLQAAYVKAVGRGGSIRSTENTVAWFYRLLRNTIIDHQRHRGREARAMDHVEVEAVSEVAPAVLRTTACRCVLELASGLKPEHAQAVRRVDVEGATVPEFAVEAGISANNAGVRLHRARQALRKRVQSMCGACAAHGCLDCSCVDRKSFSLRSSA